MKRLITATAFTLTALTAAPLAQAADSIRIAHVTGFTGPLSAYAEQLSVGMKMGLRVRHRRQHGNRGPQGRNHR